MIKAIVCGLGVIGLQATRSIAGRPDIECVGAFDSDPSKIGRDLGEVADLDRKLGVTVSGSFSEVLEQSGADIVVNATASFLEQIRPFLFSSIEAGMSFVSACEELAYPSAQYPGLAQEIDDCAKRNSVSVLGTGVNPGFVPDFLPLVFAGACRTVRRIEATRAADASMYGTELLSHFSIGQPKDHFEASLATGELIGHVGHPEQITEIADALGWQLERIDISKKPLISKSTRKGRYMTVESGNVCGLEQLAVGIKSGEEAIVLRYLLLFQPSVQAANEDGAEAGNFILVEGEPNVKATVEIMGESSLVTANRIVNSIPFVLAAQPGLLSMKDLPPFVPRCD